MPNESKWTGAKPSSPIHWPSTERPDYPIWRWFTAPLEVVTGPDGLTVIVITVFILMVGVAFAIMDKSGILKSMASRQAFLSDRSHRVRFVYFPKHTSWLNQIEIVFGIVTRRAIRRARFKSTEELKARLLGFIDYFNRTLAQPFRWTYTGRPVAAATVRRPTTWKEKWVSRREAGETLELVT